jgi:hypothetical protein
LSPRYALIGALVAIGDDSIGVDWRLMTVDSHEIVLVQKTRIAAGDLTDLPDVIAESVVRALAPAVTCTETTEDGKAVVSFRIFSSLTSAALLESAWEVLGPTEGFTISTWIHHNEVTDQGDRIKVYYMEVEFSDPDDERLKKVLDLCPTKKDR